MSELKVLKGTKEQFVKEIRNELCSPIDTLLHNLVYVGWDDVNFNTYVQEERIVDIEDCKDTEGAYYKLKKALSDFEAITGVKFVVSPRHDFHNYNTIKDENKNGEGW